MKLLDKLTENPQQTYTVVTEDGDRFTLSLRFLPSQSAWEVSVVWGAVTISGISLVFSPNLLYSYKNILPFGLMVVANDSIEPSYLDDFTSGRVQLYVMIKSDIEALEEAIQIAIDAP